MGRIPYLAVRVLGQPRLLACLGERRNGLGSLAVLGRTTTAQPSLVLVRLALQIVNPVAMECFLLRDPPVGVSRLTKRPIGLGPNPIDRLTG
jgi:hypothetical protein